MISRRNLLIGTAGFASIAALRPVIAQTKKLRFGVGPLLPNPEDTKKAYTPVFAHLAKQLGVDFELFATTDWAGHGGRHGLGQPRRRVDGAVGLRHRQQRDGLPGGRDGQVRREADLLRHRHRTPGPRREDFPEDTKGRSISFADVGSTSGWLIPTLLRKGSVEDRSEDLLEVQRRGDPRGE